VAGTRALAPVPSMDDMAQILDVFRGQALAAFAARSGARGLRGTDGGKPLTPAELEALRPHVVNLSEGLFKPSGTYSTSEGDVDAIVREHIPAWARALPNGATLRIAVWAHGGLIGERDGLEIALKHVEWWKKNGVYPIYFVWETGLFDALRSILEAVARKIPGLGTRDLFDFTTDPLVQEGVRALGGVHVWGAMKNNAALANEQDGTNWLSFGRTFSEKPTRQAAGKAPRYPGRSRSSDGKRVRSPGPTFFLRRRVAAELLLDHGSRRRRGCGFFAVLCERFAGENYRFLRDIGR